MFLRFFLLLIQFVYCSNDLFGVQRKITLSTCLMTCHVLHGLWEVDRNSER